MANPLTPLKDFSRTFVLEEYDPDTGAYAAVTTGTVTCYIATAPDDEEAADDTLSGSATYIGGNGTEPAGTWFFGLDASALTFALLDSLFGTDTPTPYLVIVKTNGTREVEKLKYVRVKYATATPAAA